MKCKGNPQIVHLAFLPCSTMSHFPALVPKGLSLQVHLLLVFKITLSFIAPKSSRSPDKKLATLVEVVSILNSCQAHCQG
jgi:hypothetical protein